MITKTAHSLAKIGFSFDGDEEVTTETEGGSGFGRKLLDVLGIGAGTAMVLNEKNRGRLTGRERFYHGVDPDMKEQVLREGIHKGTSGTSRGNSVLYKNKIFTSFQSAGKKSPIELDDMGAPTGESLKNYIKNFPFFSNKGRVTVDLPTGKFKKVKNIAKTLSPDDFHAKLKKAMDEARAFAKKHQGIDMPEHTRANSNALQKMMRIPTTIEGQIPPEYIKGSSKYRRAGFGEIKDFIKNNKAKALRGYLTAGAGAAMAGAGLYDLFRGNKESEDDI